MTELMIMVVFYHFLLIIYIMRMADLAQQDLNMTVVICLFRFGADSFEET